jgi:hypothetical protein
MNDVKELPGRDPDDEFLELMLRERFESSGAPAAAARGVPWFTAAIVLLALSAVAGVWWSIGGASRTAATPTPQDPAPVHRPIAFLAPIALDATKGWPSPCTNDAATFAIVRGVDGRCEAWWAVRAARMQLAVQRRQLAQLALARSVDGDPVPVLPIAVGNFTGKGAPEAVALQEGVLRSLVDAGTGSPTFTRSDQLVQGRCCDWDGDGCDDLLTFGPRGIVRYATDHPLHPSAFVPVESMPLIGPGPPPIAVTCADMDGDGLPDLVAAREHEIVLYRNAGNRRVPLLLGKPEVLIDFGKDQLQSVTAGDLDGDGRPDLVVQVLVPSTPTQTVPQRRAYLQFAGAPR